MIASLIYLAVFVFLVLFFVGMNAIMLSSVKRKKKFTLRVVSICSLIVLIASIICISILPNSIRYNFGYDNFDDYLFWSEGLLGLDGYAEIDGEFIYAGTDHMLDGYAREENGRVRGYETEYINKFIENFATGNKDDIYLDVYRVKGLNRMIFIAVFGENFSVNGCASVEYKEFSHNTMKVAITDTAEVYHIEYDGGSFDKKF